MQWFSFIKSTDGQPQTYQLLKGVLFNGQSGGQLVLLLTFILSSCNKNKLSLAKSDSVKAWHPASMLYGHYVNLAQFNSI